MTPLQRHALRYPTATPTCHIHSFRRRATIEGLVVPTSLMIDLQVGRHWFWHATMWVEMPAGIGQHHQRRIRRSLRQHLVSMLAGVGRQDRMQFVSSPSQALLRMVCIPNALVDRPTRPLLAFGPRIAHHFRALTAAEHLRLGPDASPFGLPAVSGTEPGEPGEPGEYRS